MSASYTGYVFHIDTVFSVSPASFDAVALCVSHLANRLIHALACDKKDTRKIQFTNYTGEKHTNQTK